MLEWSGKTDAAITAPSIHDNINRNLSPFGVILFRYAQINPIAITLPGVALRPIREQLGRWRKGRRTDIDRRGDTVRVRNLRSLRSLTTKLAFLQVRSLLSPQCNKAELNYSIMIKVISTYETTIGYLVKIEVRVFGILIYVRFYNRLY